MGRKDTLTLSPQNVNVSLKLVYLTLFTQYIMSGFKQKLEDVLEDKQQSEETKKTSKPD